MVHIRDVQAYRSIIATLLFVVATAFIIPLFAHAAEIPFGVSPKAITTEGSLDIGEPYTLGLSKGKLLQTYEYKVGNRTGVRLSGISYSLRFWNVGEMGGTSGYLFWKKDFGRATINLEYELDTPGQIITQETKTPMGPSYQMEDADSIPEVEGSSCMLRFTGGPRGTFKGTCGNGATIEGRIGGTGAFVVFEKITQPENPKDESLALQLLLNKELTLSGEFGDWKFDESTLEDSNARFSSISGEVEVRHENDTVWEFAKLGTVLYVLDHVKTSEESQAIIGFADLSTFLLKEESEIVITTPPKKDSKLRLVAGNIWANVKKMAKDGTMEVEMSQAVAGIKGTRFELIETGNSSTIKVAEGSVSFRSKADGSVALVEAGEAVTATKEGLGEKSVFDASAFDAELVAAMENATQETGTAGGFLSGMWWVVSATSFAFIALCTGIWVMWRRRTKLTNDTAY